MGVDKLKKSKLDKQLNQYLNTVTNQLLINKLSAVVKTLFKWDGLPDTIKSEYIEMALYTNGQACFFNDSKYGFMALRCNSNRALNVYGYPVSYNAYGIGYQKTVPVNKGVWIRNNINLIPMRDIVLLYANKLTEIYRTADINVQAQKMPWILAGDEKTRFSLQTILNDINDNKGAFIVDKSLDLKGLQVLITQAPIVLAELMDYKSEILNDFLTELGINNAAVDKKERLLTDEVNSNNQFIDLCGSTWLSTRQQAAEEINEMFGLNVSVSLNLTEGKEPEVEPEEVDEGENNNE